MQVLEQHLITKIITKSGSTRDYNCKEHNTSYPTLRMLKEDHPNLDEDKIIEFNKNERVSPKDSSPSLSVQTNFHSTKREKEVIQ